MVTRTLPLILPRRMGWPGPMEHTPHRRLFFLRFPACQSCQPASGEGITRQADRGGITTAVRAAVGKQQGWLRSEKIPLEAEDSFHPARLQIRQQQCWFKWTRWG